MVVSLSLCAILCDRVLMSLGFWFLFLFQSHLRSSSLSVLFPISLVLSPVCGCEAVWLLLASVGSDG